MRSETEREAKILRKAFDAIKEGKEISAEFSVGQILHPKKEEGLPYVNVANDIEAASSHTLHIDDKIYNLGKFENGNKIVEKIREKALDAEFEVIEGAMKDLGYKYKVGSPEEKTYELDIEDIIINVPNAEVKVPIERAGYGWTHVNASERISGWKFKLPEYDELKEKIESKIKHTQ